MTEEFYIPLRSHGTCHNRCGDGWVSRPGGRESVALGCEEMMRTDSGYSGAARDESKEALIDPEHRNPCGRNVTEPGTDVERSRRNAAVAKVGRRGETADSLNAVAPWEPFWCAPVLPDRVRISGRGRGVQRA